MSFQGFFQNAYVTRDLDRAIADCAASFGGGDFAPMDIELPLSTAEGTKSIHLRVATGWIGAVQVELIEPVSGHVTPYVDGLPPDPADFVPRFHHVAVRRDDPDAMRREVARLGLPIIFETGGNGISSVFVDARERFGHPLEFVFATPEGWALLGWPGSAG
jgi:hypothetical protein